MLPESQKAKIQGQGTALMSKQGRALGARSVDKEDWLAILPYSDSLGRAPDPRLPAAPTRMDGPGQLLAKKARSMAYGQVPRGQLHCSGSDGDGWIIIHLPPLIQQRGSHQLCTVCLRQDRSHGVWRWATCGTCA